jgi:hypothetical protein
MQLTRDRRQQLMLLTVLTLGTSELPAVIFESSIFIRQLTAATPAPSILAHPRGQTFATGVSCCWA